MNRPVLAAILLACSCSSDPGAPSRSTPVAPGGAIPPSVAVAPSGAVGTPSREAGRLAPAVLQCRGLGGPAEFAGTAPPSWVPAGENAGPCDLTLSDLQDGDDGAAETIGRASDGRFTIRQAGPSGSGRYWSIAVELGAARRTTGFCLTTSTSGWKRVGSHAGLAARLAPLIRVVQDVDGDGHDELVVPTSFPLDEDANPHDHALSVTVYHRRGIRFVRDEARTRTLRTKLAEAYDAAARTIAVDQVEVDREGDGAHFEKAARSLRQCLSTGENAGSRGPSGR